MNPELKAIEKRLLRAQARWEGIQLARNTAILGLVFCACLLGLGLALESGLITTKTQAVACLGCLTAGSLLTWGALIVRSWSRRPVIFNAPSLQRLG